MYDDYDESFDEMDESFDDYDESFDEMVEEAYRYRSEKSRKILEDWCKAAHIKEPVGYALDYSKSTYYIYSRQPGVLIGRGGVLGKNYTERIKKEFPGIEDIVFIEINGGFANY